MTGARPAAIALLLFLAASAAGIAVLPWYGLTWDEATGDLFYGERFLGYLIRGDRRFLDFSRPIPLLLRDSGHPDLFATHYPSVHEYFPFANQLSALSCLLLFQATGWMDAVDAHHLPVPVLAAGLSAVLFLWVGRRWGWWAGAGTAAFLLLNPRYWGEAVCNVKDVPETALFSFSLLAAAREGAGPGGRLLGSAALAGLALATKPNALFLPWLLIPWALLRSGLPRPGRAAAALALYPLVAAAVAFAVWPWLWSDPAPRIGAVAGYVMGKRMTPPHLNAEVLRDIAVTLPEPLLLLVPLGAVAALRGRERRADGLLLVLWLLVPPLRHLFFGVPHFDGIRHFLEMLPAAAALGGIGAAALGRRLRWRPRRLTPVLAAALLLPFLLALREYFPVWTAYYNRLAGGLRGARARGDQASTDYWAASYRDGIRRLNEAAPHGAAVAVLVGPHVVRAVRDAWLRPDLRLIAGDDLVFGDAPDPAYVMFVVRPSWFGAIPAYCERNVPIDDALVVAGVPIRSTYRLCAGDREVLRELGRNWRAAAARISREAPQRAFVTPAAFGFDEGRGGPLRADLRYQEVATLLDALRREPRILRSVDLFFVAPAINAVARDMARGMGLSTAFVAGTGESAVEVWRNER